MTANKRQHDLSLNPYIHMSRKTTYMPRREQCNMVCGQNVQIELVF